MSKKIHIRFRIRYKYGFIVYSYLNFEVWRKLTDKTDKAFLVFRNSGAVKSFPKLNGAKNCIRNLIKTGKTFTERQTEAK